MHRLDLELPDPGKVEVKMGARLPLKDNDQQFSSALKVVSWKRSLTLRRRGWRKRLSMMRRDDATGSLKITFVGLQSGGSERFKMQKN
jgi:hypothetical protein